MSADQDWDDEDIADDIVDRANPYNATNASRIYILPNLMTAGNLFCGFMAVLNCIQARLAESSLTGEYLGASGPDHYTRAVFLIFGAMGFDSLDGRLARLGGRESLFGAEFDSLADLVSFGVAPTLLMAFVILAPSQGFLWFRDIGWFLGFIYLLCVAVRLARFNVITNPLLSRGKQQLSADFVGLPCPSAACTVAALVLFMLKLDASDRSLDRFALGLPFLMLLIGLLMISSVRYPSGKKVDLQTKTKLRNFVGLLAVIGLVVLFREVALLCAFLGYIFYGLIRHWRRRPSAAGKM